MSAPQFVDVSAFNPSTIDWQAYKAWAASFDGTSRVAMRSSYGVGYADVHFAAYRQGALAAGVDVILYYHYAYPSFNTATDEANWQRSVVGSIRPQDVIVLDMEENVSQATADWAYGWLHQQEVNYGKRPALYASSAYIQQRLQDSRLARYPLWVANWQFSPDARPPVPFPWQQYEFVQYTDKATSIPGIAGTVDCNIFLGGTVNTTTYGPNSSDFNNWFTVDVSGNFSCKQTGCIVMGVNKALYSEISSDGNTLPIIGLPRTNELYQTGSSGYQWSVQFFERGVIVYDPSHVEDSQPGMGASYLGKYAQFMNLDPAYQSGTASTIPDTVASDIKAVKAATDQLAKDANL